MQLPLRAGSLLSPHLYSFCLWLGVAVAYAGPSDTIHGGTVALSLAFGNHTMDVSIENCSFAGGQIVGGTGGVGYGGAVFIGCPNPSHAPCGLGGAVRFTNTSFRSNAVAGSSGNPEICAGLSPHW